MVKIAKISVLAEVSAAERRNYNQNPAALAQYAIAKMGWYEINLKRQVINL